MIDTTAIVSIQIVSIQTDDTLQKRLQFSWLILININSLAVIPGQKYNTAKLYRGLEPQSEKLGNFSVSWVLMSSLSPPLLLMLLLNLSPHPSFQDYFFSALTHGWHDHSITTLAAPL